MGNAEEHRLIIPTPLGALVARHSGGDPDNPGVWLELRRDGYAEDAPLTLVEFTETEADASGQHIITWTWDDVRRDEHQTRVVHEGIEEYFRERDPQAKEKKVVILRSEGNRLIDLVLEVENFDYRFHQEAYDAAFRWNETDEEYSDYVLKELECAGYQVKVLDYETLDT